MKRLFVLSAALLAAQGVFAAEVAPFGSISLQADYAQPESSIDYRWGISSPETFVGVRARETLGSAGVLFGQLQVGVDPLAATDSVEFTAGPSFLTLQQSAFRLSVGRLPSLTDRFVISQTPGFFSLKNSGYLAYEGLTKLEQPAVSVEMTSGDYLSLGSQWVVDPATDDTPWRAGALLQTPEGSIGVVYDGSAGSEDSSLWVGQFSWKVSNAQMTYTAQRYEGEWAWDVQLISQATNVQPFIAYGESLTDEQRWAVGVQQLIAQGVTSYSEVFYTPETEQWRWSTGFELGF